MGKELKKHSHHRIVPIALITFATPIALVMIFLFIANIFYHDEKPPDDSMLRLSDVNVAEAENAYFDVAKIDKDITVADPQVIPPNDDSKVDEMLNGGIWDEIYATELIKKYAAATNDFHAAAGKELYQDPLTAHPNSLDINKFPSLSSIRFAAKLVALEGLQKAKAGDVAGGLTEAMDVLRVGQLMESGQQTLIELLVGGATKQIGLSALRQIALQATITSEQAKSISQELEAFRGNNDGLVSALKLEYAYAKTYIGSQLDLGQIYDGYFLVVNADGNVIPRSLTGKFISFLDAAGVTRFYYWPNQSWRFYIDQRKQDVLDTQANCATGNLFPERAAPYSHRNGWSRLIEPNTIGKLITDIGSVALGGVVTKACDQTLAVSATQITLAISAYQHDNKKLPDSLEALVPKYLSAVPLDPYNGKSLIYVPSKKIIYSVGQDRKDESGNTKKIHDSTGSNDWQYMFDPTFVISK